MLRSRYTSERVYKNLYKDSYEIEHETARVDEELGSQGGGHI